MTDIVKDSIDAKWDEEIINGEHEDDLEVRSLMKHRIENQEWYKALIEELSACIVETSFNARDAIIQGKHFIGSEILKHEDKFTQAGYLKASEQIALSLNKSQRDIEQCIQFARKYPDLSLLPVGKNCSWHKIVNELLPEHTQDTLESKSKPLTKQDYINLLKEIHELLKHEWEDNNKTAIEWRGGGEIGDEAERKCEYIRYLQDQIEKIEKSYDRART